MRNFDAYISREYASSCGARHPEHDADCCREVDHFDDHATVLDNENASHVLSWPREEEEVIEFAQGSILESDAEALVCPVNAVGVMGKGLAYEFRQRFAMNHWAYLDECNAERLHPGGLFVTHFDEQYVFNVATKEHWRNKSRIEWIKSGLRLLVLEVRTRDIKSIAIPALGCGLGGLKWSDVLPLIEHAACAMPDVRVIVFPPQ